MYRVIVSLAAAVAAGLTGGLVLADEAKNPPAVAKLDRPLREDPSPKQIQWSVLAPENGKPFNDPFAKLTRDQLEKLSYVVRVQRLIAEEKIAADGVDAAKSAELSRKLKKEGVDIGWLMVQRERVRQFRGQRIEALSKAIAKTLSGKKVTLTGYVIPIKVSKGRLTEFFLVPTVAACSHEAAPPRLQVVFVTTEQGIVRPEKAVPVRVTGTVAAKTTTKISVKGNGRTPVRSAYAIASAQVEVYGQQAEP